MLALAYLRRVPSVDAVPLIKSIDDEILQTGRWQCSLWASNTMECYPILVACSTIQTTAFVLMQLEHWATAIQEPLNPWYGLYEDTEWLVLQKITNIKDLRASRRTGSSVGQ